MALRRLDPYLDVGTLASLVDASDLDHFTDEDRLRPVAWRRWENEVGELSDELWDRHPRPAEADERSWRPVLNPDAVVTLDELSTAELLARLENALGGVAEVQYRYGLLLGLTLGAKIRSAVNDGRDPAVGVSAVLSAVLDVLDTMNTADGMRELAYEEQRRKSQQTGTTPMLEWLRDTSERPDEETG